MSLLKNYRMLGANSRLYLLFISYFWLFEYFSAFWRRLHVDVSIANFIVFLFLSFLCYRTWHHRIRLSEVILYLFIVCGYLLSAILYTNTQAKVYDSAFEVVCATVPFLFIGVIFKAKEFDFWIAALSRFAIILNVFYSLFSSSDASADVEEQMHKAYILLPSVLYLLWLCFEHFRLLDILFFLVGFFMECSMGSRGPFVCIMFFAASYLLFFKKYKYKDAIRPIIVVISFFLYLISEYFANFMIVLLARFGKSTRIFDHMLDDSLVNYEMSTGRNEVQAELFNLLSTDNEGFGFGLFADRAATGFYSHNIFIELWFSFGYIIGSVLVGAFLLLFILFLYKSKDSFAKTFALIFFTTSFVKLNFSGSFIFDNNLFFLIGFCINGLRESYMYRQLKSM